MRYLAVLAFALGCGSSHPPRSGAGSDAPKRVDPRSSRELLIRTAFALLGTGDAEALIGLADPKDAVRRSLECPPETSKMDVDPASDGMERKLAAAAEAGKGVSVEVLEVEDGEPRTIASAGETLHGCTVKADLADQTVKVKLRVREDGADVESTVSVDVRSIGGRWYLRSMPAQLDGGEMIRKFAAYTDQVCACTDAACMTAATDAYSKWTSAYAKAHAGRPEMPSPDEMKKVEALAKRMSDCMTKLAAGQATP